MSTISLPFEDQIRHFFVVGGLADALNLTLEDFLTSANAAQAIGDATFVDDAGTIMTAANAATAVGDISLVKLNSKGTVSQSDRITPGDMTYLAGVSPVAKVGKSQDLTLGGTINVGDEFVLIGKVHYGNSEENFITFWAGHQAVTGDTAETVMDSLAVQMATNLANSINTSTRIAGTSAVDGTTLVKDNKYFTLDSSVAGTLTIAEKDWILEDFRVGLRTHDQLMWNFELQKSDAAAAATITKAETPGTYAKGQGYQMIELERFLVGHRAEFELKDITLSFDRMYDVDINTPYYCLDLKYFDISRDDPKHSDKMLTIVSDDIAVINGLGAILAAASGLPWTTLT